MSNKLRFHVVFQRHFDYIAVSLHEDSEFHPTIAVAAALAPDKRWYLFEILKHVDLSISSSNSAHLADARMGMFAVSDA